jgi:hypothetical protein
MGQVQVGVSPEVQLTSFPAGRPAAIDIPGNLQITRRRSPDDVQVALAKAPDFRPGPRIFLVSQCVKHGPDLPHHL